MKIDKILVVGLGSIGKRHLKILRNFYPKADIRVLRHQYSNIIPKFSDGIYTKIKEALEFGPQIAVISNPLPYHMRYAIPLAKIGCNLLIEKPISENKKQIQQLINLRDEKKILVQVGYNLRFDKGIRYLKKLVSSKKFGKIFSIRCEAGNFLPNWRLNSDYTKEVSANKNLGGGVLLELSHELDYLQWLFGNIVNISAKLRHHSKLKIDVEDTAYINLDISQKNKKNLISASLNLDFVRHDSTRTCTIICEKGTVRWDGIKCIVEKITQGERNWKTLYRYNQKKDDTYKLEWEAFLISMKKKNMTEVSIESARQVMDIIHAARISNNLKNKYIQIKIN